MKLVMSLCYTDEVSPLQSSLVFKKKEGRNKGTEPKTDKGETLKEGSV